MKRIAIILFSFYFFVVSIGLLFDKHSCGEKVSYSLWGITLSNAQGCKCNHKEESKHPGKCCSDISKLVKAKTDVSKTQTSIAVNKLQLSSVPNVFSNDLALENTLINRATYRVTHSPPNSCIPLFLRDCTLLI